MNYSDTEREEIIKRICGLIIQDSVEEACKQAGIAESTFYVWMAADDVLSEEYARARKAIAFKDEQAIENTVRAVENGQIDPAAARAAIDGRKWLAGKRHPKVFGDKQTIEQTGKDGGPIQHAHIFEGLTTDELKALAKVGG